jgi:hypothetical protein
MLMAILLKEEGKIEQGSQLGLKKRKKKVHPTRELQGREKSASRIK